MATLTWREVQAPQLSTRDLALAGQTMVSGFDRLGQVLANRAESLRKKATGQAVAQAYMAQDPAAIAQLRAQGLDGLDPRVDPLVYAQALSTAESQLMERQRANEELLGLQADSQFGTVIAGLADAALSGDANAEAALKAGRENDPMFARALARHYATITGFRDDRTDNVLEERRFGEDVRSNKATEAGNAAERALRAREINARERAQREADEGFRMGQDLARDYRLEDLASARAKLHDDKRFTALSPTQQRGVLEAFDAAHAALTAETSGTRGGLPNPSARLLALEAEGNAAEGRARDPALRGLRVAAKHRDITMPELVGEIDSRGGWQMSRGMSQDVINKILSDATVTLPNGEVVRPDLSDIRGALDAHGYAEGIGKQIPVWGELPIWLANRALTERTRQIVQQRAAGYTANEAVDVAARRAPIEATSQQIAQTRAELNRYLRAHERGQLTASQMLEMEEVRARYNRLLNDRAQ